MARIPSTPSGGARHRKATALRAEMEATAAAAKQKAGPQFHQVQEGETLESIAGRYGQSSEAIWQHPLNKQLKNRLGTPGGLGRGDGIYIPEAEQEQEQQQSGGPVGQGDYVVKNGDCLSSIAKNTGHFWETLWNESANAELKEVRKDPNVLLPGDRVTIPELQKKEEPGETEQRHRFVRRGEPAKLHLRILDDGEPVANQPYSVTIDGEPGEDGTTDADGNVQLPIAGNVKRVVFLVGGEDEQIEYVLNLGVLSPISELSGVQQRLKNLGYTVRRTDGRMDELTAVAIARFQYENGLPETGEPDQKTQDLLLKTYGG